MFGWRVPRTQMYSTCPRPVRLRGEFRRKYRWLTRFPIVRQKAIAGSWVKGVDEQPERVRKNLEGRVPGWRRNSEGCETRGCSGETSASYVCIHERWPSRGCIISKTTELCRYRLILSLPPRVSLIFFSLFELPWVSLFITETRISFSLFYFFTVFTFLSVSIMP